MLNALGKSLLSDGQGSRGAAVLLAACDRGALDGCCLLGQVYEGQVSSADLPGMCHKRPACTAGRAMPVMATPASTSAFCTTLARRIRWTRDSRTTAIAQSPST